MQLIIHAWLGMNEIIHWPRFQLLGRCTEPWHFHFLRWNGVKSSRRRLGEVHEDPPHKRAPPPSSFFPFFSIALQTQSTFGTGRQQQATWEQPSSCRVSGSQSDPDSFTRKQGDRPWNVLPAVTQIDNAVWKELKANKKMISCAIVARDSWLRHRRAHVSVTPNTFPSSWEDPNHSQVCRVYI